MLASLHPRSLILILVVVSLATVTCGLTEQAAEKLQPAAEKMNGKVSDTSTPQADKPDEQSSAQAKGTPPPADKSDEQSSG